MVGSTNSSMESGFVIGVGATNSRTGYLAEGDLTGFKSVLTPGDSDEFFRLMAGQVLDAADRGCESVVAGFPGPVSEDGLEVGPLVNVPGLSQQRYDLVKELTKTDSAITGLLEDGFSIFAVNDGTLAAHAAASRVGENGYSSVSALILGTGVGTGVVEKDEQGVYRVAKDPLEIGHITISPEGNPTNTYESNFSGPALEKSHGKPAEEFAAKDIIWEEVGKAVGTLAMILGCIKGVKLVVPTGGVGAGASDMYKRHLEEALEQFNSRGNSTQKLFLPEVKLVPASEAQVFELYGGQDVVADFKTRNQQID